MWVSLDGTLTGMLPKLPMVLGHEVAGVVTELGQVSGVEVGDRVVILGPAQHAPGWSADGGFADKVLAMAEGLTMLRRKGGVSAPQISMTVGTIIGWRR